MPKLKLKTNLRCSACEESIRPFLAKIPDLSWRVDFSSQPPVLTVEGEKFDRQAIEHALNQAGYKSLGLVASESASSPPPSESKPSYHVLILLLLYLLGVTCLIQWNHGSWNWMHWMSHFMSGFFLIFSFFKLLDLPGFATTYRGYDLLAKIVPVYGYVYPFLELGLGAFYLLDRWTVHVNCFALILGILSTVGVVSTLRQGKKVKCACLGTGFNLPMSVVTLIEDLIMVGMAGIMLILA